MTSRYETAVRPLPGYRTQTLEPQAPLPHVLPHPWLSLVILALLIKAVLIGLTLSKYGANPDPLTALAREWTQWDARLYLTIASQGYSGVGDARNLIAFFPLYPTLIHLIARTGLAAPMAALLISNVAGVIAAIVLFELARIDHDDRCAWRAAAFFTVFPTAYFLLMPYTEATFCALAFSCVLMVRRRSWLAAGVLGGLAAATRLTGLALIPVVLVEAWMARRLIARLWQPMAATLGIAAGLGTYLAANLFVLGSPLAFVAVQRQHWYHTLSPPWVGFANAVRSVGWRVPWEKLTVGGGEIAGGITAYAAATLSWLRLRPSDALYATLFTAMVTFLPFWLSIPRYLLAMYPLFLLVGRVRNRWIYLALVLLSLSGLVVFGLAYGKGWWAF